MPDAVHQHRRFLIAAGMAGAGLLLAGADAGAAATPQKHAQPKKGAEKPVGAVEDLMREHGVIRRVLLVYRETAGRLESNPANVDPRPIADAAKLFRTFGEDYHEKKLEEGNIFPALRKAGGPAAAYIDVLIAQHDRGREITDYILAITGKGAIGSGDIEPLQRAFIGMDLMYANHAAREDTIVFPAWKAAISRRQLREMGEKFEDIERAQFGKDGFEHVVAQIGRIELAMGFADLAEFTAPAPPKT